MEINKAHVVEVPVRASDSTLWDIQRNFYRSLGIQAWDGRVPFYISSNAFIATRYATILVHAIIDWLRLNPALRSETFYILEAGCGTGKFSFYLLKSFEHLLKVYQLEDLHYCYIISDIVESNIEFCQNNESFSPFIKKGKIDFAIFDLTEDHDFFLLRREKKYSDLQVKTPLSVITNYVLDSLVTDLFKHTPEGFKEVLLGIKSRYKTFNTQEAKHLEDLRLIHDLHEIKHTQYYSDPHLTGLLTEYHEQFPDKTFFLTFPLGAILFLQTLSKLTKDNYFLIAGDKGIASDKDIPLVNADFMVSFTGSFSFLMNFNALARYQRKVGGEALLSDSGEIFNISLYSKGYSFKDLERTRSYYEAIFSRFGPQEYCDLCIEYVKHDYRFSDQGLIALLRISEYDPDAYGLIHDRLTEVLLGMDPLKWRRLRSILLKIEDNIYNMASGEDLSRLLGTLFMLKNEEERAIKLFNRSIEIFKDKSLAYRDLGMIYEKQNQGHPIQAQEYYQKAYEFNKYDLVSKRKYLELSGQSTFRWVIPFLKLAVVCVAMVAIFYALKFF